PRRDRRRVVPQPEPALAQRQRVRVGLLRVGCLPRDGGRGPPRSALPPHGHCPDDAGGPSDSAGDAEPAGDPRRRALDDRVRLQELPTGFGSFLMPSLTPIAVLYGAIPVAGGLVALFTVEELINGWRRGFEGADRPPVDPEHLPVT